MSEENRELLRRKLLEGVNRFAAINPGLDLSYDSPDSARAEDELNAIGVTFIRGETTLERVRDKFTVWKEAILARDKQTQMF